ncbi:MAG: PA2779 family protein [Acidobacteriaceae bacterium]
MNKLPGSRVNCVAALLLGVAMAVPQPMPAQNHVVSPAQIQGDVAGASAVRQNNEKQLRSFLATKEMQQVMKSEGVNPQQVTNAVSRLNDADLARLSARSAKAQSDFAAGRMSGPVLFLIGAAIVAIILIVVFA